MKSRYFFIFLLLVITGAFIGCSDEEDPQSLGSLEGYVKNEFEQPIEGVTIETKNVKVKTTKEGYYHIKSIPTGPQIVSVYIDHYLPQNKEINILKQGSNLDFILRKGESYIEISDSLYSTGYKGGNKTISVFSNSSWYIENNEIDWLVFSNTQGAGNGVFTIQVLPNNGESKRNVELQIVSGEDKISIQITQESELKILGVKGIIGNDEIQISDSVEVIFDREVSIESITTKYDLCLSDIKYNLIPNGVRFSYACARIGEEYTFQLSGKTEDGESFNKSIMVPFYEKKEMIEGFISNIDFGENDSYCWITATEPNMLYYFNLKKFTVERKIRLNFEPLKVVINPYNKYLYIIPDNFNKIGNRLDNHIYVLNPNSGAIVKKIEIKPSPDLLYPYIYPMEIIIAKSGLGVCVLKDSEASGSAFRIIETNIDDNVRHLNENELPQETFPSDLGDLYLNYNGSKIIANTLYRTDHYYEIDGVTKKMQKVKVDMTFASMPQESMWAQLLSFTPSRFKNEGLALAGPVGLRIVSLDSKKESNPIFLNNLYAVVDFHATRDNVIYFADFYNYSTFKIIDLNKPKVLFSTGIISQNGQYMYIFSSKDKEHIFMYQPKSFDIATAFYRFKVSDFQIP